MLAAAPVETHDCFDIGICQRSSIGLSRQRRQDGSGARQFLRGRRRTADENLLAAGGLFGRQTVDGTLNRHLADLRRLHNTFDGVVVEDAAAVRLIQENMRDVRVRNERQSDVMLARLDRNSNFILVGLHISR